MTHASAPRERFLRCFDEDRYLDANPDVADAVRTGVLRSGRQHYERFGFAEGRDLGLPSRRERLLSGVDPARQRGIEIGALMTPVVARAEGDVLFVDHADTETLRRKYTGDPNVDASRIVPVDVVWDTGPLRDVLAPGYQADYVVASHVIEHVPDMIRWLGHIREVLAPDGMLRLAVPDRRFTFDVLRVETRLHDLLDAYLLEAKVPTPHVVLDHCSHFRAIDTRAAWLGTLDVPNLPRLFSPAQYLGIARRAVAGEYLDVHCWVFTPASFAAAMEQACGIGLVRLACTDFHFPHPFGNEFMVGLRPSDDGAEAAASWARMRDAAERLDA